MDFVIVIANATAAALVITILSFNIIGCRNQKDNLTNLPRITFVHPTKTGVSGMEQQHC